SGGVRLRSRQWSAVTPVAGHTLAAVCHHPAPLPVLDSQAVVAGQCAGGTGRPVVLSWRRPNRSGGTAVGSMAKPAADRRHMGGADASAAPAGIAARIDQALSRDQSVLNSCARSRGLRVLWSNQMAKNAWAKA